MAILTKDEVLEKVKNYVGDDTTDEALRFVEDITDTINDLSNNDSGEWEKKYHDLDEEWRKKYIDRFFSTSDEVEDEEDEEDEEGKEVTYDDLFTTKEVK